MNFQNYYRTYRKAFLHAYIDNIHILFVCSILAAIVACQRIVDHDRRTLNSTLFSVPVSVDVRISQNSETLTLAKCYVMVFGIALYFSTIIVSYFNLHYERFAMYRTSHQEPPRNYKVITPFRTRETQKKRLTLSCDFSQILSAFYKIGTIIYIPVEKSIFVHRTVCCKTINSYRA